VLLNTPNIDLFLHAMHTHPAVGELGYSDLLSTHILHTARHCRWRESPMCHSSIDRFLSVSRLER